MWGAGRQRERSGVRKRQDITKKKGNLNCEGLCSRNIGEILTKFTEKMT